MLNHFALLAVFFVRNSLAFLCFWEIMTLSAFLMVIFEYHKMETLKAGMNYLIQSHISIIILTLGFIWVYASTGSFDFSAITGYCLTGGKEAALLLFLIFFIGFAIKAGFVPFHTWLPHAHPAAPSHVSGLMSGVIIKSGIYGILRMLLLIPDNLMIIGYIILLISIVTSVYGVMLATVQHNIKRLLAYHSIENIGIIGIGIALGTLGKGLHNPYLAFAGFTGALLHTLNHSLFKSLLFFASGSIFQRLHTLDIEKMGGLIKKMPRTALLFLIAALAICGLPPFNGFISEFLIYSGLFRAVSGPSSSVIILGIIGLALTGGLALVCFTKAFGIIFLGTRRSNSPAEIGEISGAALFPKYMIALLMVTIGLFPWIFFRILQKPVGLFVPLSSSDSFIGLTAIMQKISLSVWIMVLLVVVIYFIRKALTRRVVVTTGPTWGCGYAKTTPVLQYTAGSFVRSYAKLIRPVVIMKKSEDKIQGINPEPIQIKTYYSDKIETGLVDWPVRNLKGFLGRFKFLQNGSVQFYVLYGVVFIGISIIIPLIINTIQYFAQLLKQI
jgi:formate hydrogenlyase subunit 3/multisubunit Na+/H+ antiporter MnhD subunit